MAVSLLLLLFVQGFQGRSSLLLIPGKLLVFQAFFPGSLGGFCSDSFFPGSGSLCYQLFQTVDRILPVHVLTAKSFCFNENVAIFTNPLVRKVLQPELQFVGQTGLIDIKTQQDSGGNFIDMLSSGSTCPNRTELNFRKIYKEFTHRSAEKYRITCFCNATRLQTVTGLKIVIAR